MAALKRGERLGQWRVPAAPRLGANNLLWVCLRIYYQALRSDSTGPVA